MNKFNISKFYPCKDGAAYYATQTDFISAWNNCNRGDWMLWIAKKLQVDDKLMYLAAGKCANTVRHLMKDDRSKAAVDAAIAYGNGEISEEELKEAAKAAADAAKAAADAAYYDAAAEAAAEAAYDAADAVAAAYAAAADAAYYDAAAEAAAKAAYDAADAVAAAYAAAADAVTAAYAAAEAAYAAYAAVTAAYAAARAAENEEENQLQTADICREVLTKAVMEKINI